MADLIDRQALVEQMESDAEQMEDMVFKMATYAAINDVKHQPAADVAPVRHGHWIFKTDRRVVDGYDWQCDQCKSWQRYTSNFCPNCGARMDGEA